jgi:hypothetical protein
MRLWKRLLVGCLALLFLGLAAGAAQATSTSGCADSGSGYDPFGLGEVPSGNGELIFSNFRFHSPGCSVDPDDLTITILDDGVEIAGPITVTGKGWAKFYVSYEVTAVEPLLIDGASLTLASSIGHPDGAVLATKRVIGGRPDKPDGHPWNDHGWGHLGWGLIREIEGQKEPQKLPAKTLAYLKTAEWVVEQKGKKDCLSDTDCVVLSSGEFRFDEQTFDPHASLKVIDGAWIRALDEQSNVTFISSINRFRAVPEPTTGALLGLGLLGLAAVRRLF